MTMKNGLINQAKKVQAAGRNGDTILAHINPQEARMLKAAGGSGTINPETGLPEFGFFSRLVKTAAVAAGAYFLGPAGAGLVSGSVATGAAIGAAATGLSGGNPIKGAVIGGITGGIANFVSNGGLSDPSNWMSNLGDSFKGGGVTGNVAGSVAGNVEKTIASGQASAAGITPSPTEFLNAPPSLDSTINSMSAPVSGATDYMAQIQQGVPTSSVAQEVARSAAHVNIPGQMPPAPEPGLINKMATWAGNNPVPALMAGTTIASGIGGVATAEAQAEQARLNREAQLQMNTVQGGFGHGGFGVNSPTLNDPNLVTDMAGRYIRGPLAGQYAPGRAPGLINAARA